MYLPRYYTVLTVIVAFSRYIKEFNFRSQNPVTQHAPEEENVDGILRKADNGTILRELIFAACAVTYVPT